MTEWPETLIVNGQRVNSPYIVKNNGEFWCAACKVRLMSPQHLAKRQHVNKVWNWCYGCTDGGWNQKPKCEGAVFDSREVNDRYWRDSPGSDEVQRQGGQAFSARAALASGEPPGNVQSGGSSSDDQVIGGIKTIISDLAELATRGQAQLSDTLEYRKLLADAMEEQQLTVGMIRADVQEQEKVMKAIKADIQQQVEVQQSTQAEMQKMQEQIEVMKSIKVDMQKMEGEMLAQMRVQAEMLVEVKATNHKVTQVESVVNSLCPRGHSFRRRGEVKTLGASASTGSLLVPYNQHQASGDIEMDARGQSSHA